MITKSAGRDVDKVLSLPTSQHGIVHHQIDGAHHVVGGDKTIRLTEFSGQPLDSSTDQGVAEDQPRRVYHHRENPRPPPTAGAKRD